MQAPSADETIQRLIFGLSELDELGETIISGHGNFSVSSRTYLRMILGTLQVTGGAILLFRPTENTLTIKSSVNVRDESLVIRVPPDQIPGFLAHPFIDLSNPPEVLQPFLEQIQSHLDSLDARFWFPLRIRDEFLGVISLGAFFDANEIEDWNRELLNVFANHTSIAIAYSQLLIRSRAERFRLFMLSDTATQICKSLDTEAVQEEVVTHVVSLLDANAGELLRINPYTGRLEMKSLFSLESQANAELRNLSIPLKTDEESHPTLSMLADVATQEGKPLIWNDEDKAAILGHRNLIAVPMRGREEILGVLVVADKVGRSGVTLDFTDGDRILLEAFANQRESPLKTPTFIKRRWRRANCTRRWRRRRKSSNISFPTRYPRFPAMRRPGFINPAAASEATITIAFLNQTACGTRHRRCLRQGDAGGAADGNPASRGAFRGDAENGFAEHGVNPQLTAECQRHLRQICDLLLCSVTDRNRSGDLHQRRPQRPNGHSERWKL